MVEWLKQMTYALSLRLKSRARLEAENLVLRQQLNVLISKLPKRFAADQFGPPAVGLAVPFFPSILSVIRIVRPDDSLAPSRLSSPLTLKISPGRRPATARR